MLQILVICQLTHTVTTVRVYHVRTPLTADLERKPHVATKCDIIEERTHVGRIRLTPIRVVCSPDMSGSRWIPTDDATSEDGTDRITFTEASQTIDMDPVSNHIAGCR